MEVIKVSLSSDNRLTRINQYYVNLVDSTGDEELNIHGEATS